MAEQARVWTKEEIKHLIASNDVMVGRSLVKLLERQTSDEVASEETRHTNGRGFNSADAKIGTGLAKFYQRYDSLSEKQLARARKFLPKYAGQLVEEANS